jgi:hypothetical protein
MRGIKIARECIKKLNLDLSDLTVLTEAGSGAYIYSPLIALLAGAKKVIAIAPNSRWTSHDWTDQRLRDYMSILSIDNDRIDIVENRTSIRNQIDVFLNLGFVRPVDKELLDRSNRPAVVAYMREAWEYRHDDVDMDLCFDRRIPVVGVNEDFGGANVFQSCGQLLLKMLFEAGQEVAGCKYLIVGNGVFSEIASRTLESNNASVGVIANDGNVITNVKQFDAVIVADYNSGKVEIEWPSDQVEVINFVSNRRMEKTLAHLGTRPVVALHCLGMKAAEVVYKGQEDGEYKDLIQIMKG